MNESLSRKVISITMEFIHKNGYQDIDDFASKVSNVYCKLLQEDAKVRSDDFLRSVKNIRTSFFRINRVSKHDFVGRLFSELSQIDLARYTKASKFDMAKNFISAYLEIGFDRSKFINERRIIIAKFGNIKSPHAKLMDAFETLLQKIAESFQIALHGTKEYSGIDVSKKIQEAIIGFQIKSVNDDISEDKVRSQTSKALEYGVDGFVWIYGRPSSKDVDSSIQATYHHFTRINKKKEMYCTLIHPELLAELFRKYGIDL